jgi:glycerol uptake facilitator protein
MNAFVAEMMGTALLITLGNGVVANVVLDKTKGNNGGLIAITFGWAMAVFVGVFTTANVSGAHLNPAVTIGLAVIGKFSWALVPAYFLAQLIGSMLGALLVWIIYRHHFNETKDAALNLAVFSTAPSIRNAQQNFLTEFLATFIFLLVVLFITKSTNSLGSIDALPVALVVLAIGLSLGGPTGYAINPVRDLGPRIMHSLLPIKHKGSSDWKYAWIPIIAPVAGAIAAAIFYQLLTATN